MALPSSGQITLNQIGTEFGTSSTLKSNYGKGGASASGDITIKEFYGRSNSLSYTLATSGSIFTETDGTTGEVFVNSSVGTDTYPLGASYAGCGFDGQYYLAIMDASAITLNSFSTVAWQSGGNSIGDTANGTWRRYTYPTLGYTVAYLYGYSASTLYSSMSSSGNQVTYTFKT